MALFSRLHDEGQTIIMVTHEADIACHADRIIRMEDGKVISDLPIARDPASKHLKATPTEEAQA